MGNIHQENAILRENMKQGHIVGQNDSMIYAVLKGDAEKVSELIHQG